MIAVIKIFIFVLVVALFIFAGSMILLQSRALLIAPQALQPLPKEPELQFQIPANASVAERVQIAQQRIAAYNAYWTAVKAVADANAKQQPIAVYSAVIKDVLLGILTTMLAAFVTYAFSIAVTDIGHNIAVSKPGVDPTTLKKFSLFPTI
jgi:hypothetical protein